MKKTELDFNFELRNILLINKPKGITSFDVIRRLRKITKIKKMGHTGTLDPLATGLLIILIGKATKLSDQFLKLNKEYKAEIFLGATSNTYDSEGKISKISNKKYQNQIPNKLQVTRVLDKFKGEIEQTPPKFSAIKIKGKKAYDLARSGKDFDIKPRKVKIHNLEIIDYSWPTLKLKISCSKGTYIRSLANDIGENLKTGAYLKELTRTKIGEINIKNASELDKINNENWKNNLITTTSKKV